MAKAYLSYDLKNYDDSLAHARALKSRQLVNAVYQISSKLNEIANYPDLNAEFTHEDFIKILLDNQIHLDDLIL